MQFPRSLFRRRARSWTFGLAGCAAVLGLAFVFGYGPLTGGIGNINRSLGESAWREALAGTGAPHAWPWQATRAADAAPVVRQLGFSAVFADNAAAPRSFTKLTRMTNRDRITVLPAVVGGQRVASLSADGLAVGDRVTLVTPDGLSHVYRVTSREVVGAHTADAQNGVHTAKHTIGKQLASAKSTCGAHGKSVATKGALRLVIEAVQIDGSRRPTPEQKL